MKFKNIISYLIISLVLSIIFCPKVKGDPVAAPGSYAYFFIPLLIFMFLITFAVEYAIIYQFTKNFIDKRSKLLKSIFAVNFFTFPTTQMLALALLSQNSFNFGIYFLIELIPIFLECLFFLKIYPDLRIPIKNSTILLSTISANLATFALGLLVGIPQMIIFF